MASTGLSNGTRIIISGEIILVTDADCQVNPGWAEAIVAHFTPETGMVGGVTLLEYPKDDSGFWARLQALDWLFLQAIASGMTGAGRPVSILGNNFAFRRAAYDETGGFRRIGFSLTEDMALMQAIAGLKQAVQLDPEFVPAWLSMADAYLQIHEKGWARNMVWLELAQQSAVKVIQLDSLQGQAYQVMGRVHQLRGDDLHAEYYYRKALSIHPRLALSWAGLGQIFSRFGLYARTSITH